MLLERTGQPGAQGRAELFGRAKVFQRFQRREQQALLQSARRCPGFARSDDALPLDEKIERKRSGIVCTKIRRGALSQARQVLAAADIAPRNAARPRTR